MRNTVVAVLMRLLIGDTRDLEYEDGERHPLEDPRPPEDGDAESDWMAFDPSIRSALAQIADVRTP